MKPISKRNIGSSSPISKSVQRSWRKLPDQTVSRSVGAGRFGVERPQGFGSSYRHMNSRIHAARNFARDLLGRQKMTESKNRRGDRLDKRVRKSIEEERARDKSKEDEVVNSSDDSFPASDPPSFTGVTSAAEGRRRRISSNQIACSAISRRFRKKSFAHPPNQAPAF